MVDTIQVIHLDNVHKVENMSSFCPRISYPRHAAFCSKKSKHVVSNPTYIVLNIRHVNWLL